MPLMHLGDISDARKAEIIAGVTAEYSARYGMQFGSHLAEMQQDILNRIAYANQVEGGGSGTQPPLQPPTIDYGKPEDSSYSKYMMYGLGAVGLLIVYKMFFMKKSA